MKFSSVSLLALSAAAVSGRFIEKHETEQIQLAPEETFVVETSPGEYQEVTEEGKWELRRVSGSIELNNMC
jgi:hypothetical protein